MQPPGCGLRQLHPMLLPQGLKEASRKNCAENTRCFFSAPNCINRPSFRQKRTAKSPPSYKQVLARSTLMLSLFLHCPAFRFRCVAGEYDTTVRCLRPCLIESDVAVRWNSISTPTAHFIHTIISPVSLRSGEVMQKLSKCNQIYLKN